jgi:hypothetical protein
MVFSPVLLGNLHRAGFDHPGFGCLGLNFGIVIGLWQPRLLVLGRLLGF